MGGKFNGRAREGRPSTNSNFSTFFLSVLIRAIQGRTSLTRSLRHSLIKVTLRGLTTNTQCDIAGA